MFGVAVSAILFDIVNSVIVIDDYSLNESQDILVTILKKLESKDKKPYFIYNEVKYNI